MDTTTVDSSATQAARYFRTRNFPPPLPHRMESMKGPAFSNWLIKQHVLVGPHPGNVGADTLVRNLRQLLEAGVTTFVALQEEMDPPDASGQKRVSLRPSKRSQKLYGHRNAVTDKPYIDDAKIIVDAGGIELTHELSFLHLPIPEAERGATVSDEVVKPFVLKLLSHILDGELLYLHCSDGNGRSGTIGAVLLGLVYEMSSSIALDAVGRYRSFRFGVPGPGIETHEQKMQVHRILADKQFRSAAKAVRATPSASSHSPEVASKEVRDVVATIRQQLCRMGMHSFIQLTRTLRGIPPSDPAAFVRAVRQFGIRFTDEQASATVQGLRSKDGQFDLSAFLSVLQGQLSDFRRDLVNLAFGALDTNKSGFIELADIAVLYNASRHPEVLSSKKTEKQVLREFLDMFEVASRSQQVSLQSFTDYYAKLSCAIDDDNLFQMLIWNTWPVSKHRAAGNLRQHHAVPAKAAYGEGARGSGGRITAGGAVGRDVEAILQKLRKELGRRGAYGVTGLGWSMYLADADDGDADGTVDRFEFEQGMSQAQVHMGQYEIDALWDYFDPEGTGRIVHPHAMEVIRGRLSARRAQAVRSAFAKLDHDNTGTVDLNSLLAQFHSERHPAVLAGRATAEDMFKEFVETFRMGLRDNQVRLPHFETYYEGISSFVDEDEYFEMLLWNTWNLGGKAAKPVRADAATIHSRTNMLDDGIVAAMEKAKARTHESRLSASSPFHHRAPQRTHFGGHPAEVQHASVLGSKLSASGPNDVDKRGGIAHGKALLFEHGSNEWEAAGLASKVTSPVAGQDKMYRSHGHKAGLNVGEASAFTASNNQQGQYLRPRERVPGMTDYTPSDHHHHRSATLERYEPAFHASERRGSEQFITPGRDAQMGLTARERAYEQGVGAGTGAGVSNIGLSRGGLTPSDPYHHNDDHADGDAVLFGRDRGRKRGDAFHSRTYESHIPWDSRDGPTTSHQEVEALRNRFAQLHNTPQQGYAHQRGQQHPRAPVNTARLNAAKETILSQLRRRGLRGLFDLRQSLHAASNGSGSQATLVLDGLCFALKHCGIGIADGEVALIFESLQNYGADGAQQSVSVESVMDFVKGDLTGVRRDLVHQAYHKLDRHKNNRVPVDSVRLGYKSDRHPDVISGRRREADVLRDFLETFTCADRDGFVSRDAFEGYYSFVSPMIADDNEFQLMLWNTWELQRVQPALAALTTDKQKLYTRDTSFTSSRMGVQNTPRRAPGSAAAALGQHVTFSGANSDAASYSFSEHQGGAPGHSSNASVDIKGGQKQGWIPDDTFARPSAHLGSAAVGAGEVMQRVRQTMSRKNPREIVRFASCCRALDHDASGVLSLYDLSKALRDAGLGLSEPELRSLFSSYEVDRTGLTEYEHILADIIGTLPPNRQQLVDAAFNRLDADGDRLLTFSELQRGYNARADADVKSGRKTEAQIIREFLSALAALTGRKDKLVSDSEFRQYYACVSLTIDDDAYFQLMMWNTWQVNTRTR